MSNRPTIKLVDGFKIRNTLDIDFTVFHCHSSNGAWFAPKFYIPENEAWLDYKFESEKNFLIQVEEIEYPQNVKTYSEQRQYLKDALTIKETIPSFKISENIEGELNFVMVDGKIIRSYIDPEFVFGGHEFVYEYVPTNEIWLDSSMDEAEIQFVKLHEKVEWEFMKQGKNYDIAHEYANTIEKEDRRLKGYAAYPGDDLYKWQGKTNEELAKEYYV